MAREGERVERRDERDRKDDENTEYSRIIFLLNGISSAGK